MEPTDIRPSDPVMRLRNALGDVADVRSHNDAEEPILAPPVRTMLFQWLTEIRAEQALWDVGVKPRSSALLYGPPGCGKTTLAHHLAARLGIPLVIVGPETILASYMGEAERNVGKLFNGLAKANTPCVLFMDELEAIGGKRSKNKSGGADNARTSTLTVLLRKIEEYQGYFCAATNRPEDIDPALWRRFHIQVGIGLPSLDERFAILRRYGLPFNFDDDDLELLSELSDGASPALLRGLMEGIKRALIIQPKLGFSIKSPRDVIPAIVASVSPPPEMTPPTLWSDETAMAQLDRITWPPALSKGPTA